MELTLKRLLEQAEFTQVKRGGYDRDEVNTLLDRAVAMATKVEAKLTETMEQARSGGGPSEAQIEAEVARRVEAALASRPAEAAGPSDEEQAEEAARALLLAQRTADAAVREAREDAARILADADAEAARARSELAETLEAERANAKGRIRTEITELEGLREALRTDVGLLERHVEEQRNQLRSTLGELQRLLDDPSGFRLAPTPALADPAVPADDTTPLIEGASRPAPTEPEPVERGPGPSTGGWAESPSGGRAPEATPGGEGAADDGSDLDFGTVEHAPPGRGRGEETRAVDIVPEPDEDSFMAELRKAIEDEEPLGPRDPEPTGETPNPFEGERRGWRFGKR